MESVFNYILDLFGQIIAMMQNVKFSAWGFTVSLFWLIVSITFMGFLFSVLLPFASRANSEYQKATSERVKKGH